MTIVARRVTEFDDLQKPGQFMFTGRQDWAGHGGMIFVCPCGCGSPRCITFRGTPNPDNHPTWEWDGNEDKPTLTPSLLSTTGCKWHGFLTEGEFHSC